MKQYDQFGRTRLRFEQLEDRALLAVAAFEINLYQDVGGVPGNLITNDTVQIGQNFFAEITAREYHPFFGGLGGISLDISWNPNVLQEIDTPFNPSALITHDLPAYQKGTLNSETGTISDLGGSAILSSHLGRAIGNLGFERFALLHFQALGPAEDSHIFMEQGRSRIATVPVSSLGRAQLRFETQTITVITPQSGASESSTDVIIPAPTASGSESNIVDKPIPVVTTTTTTTAAVPVESIEPNETIVADSPDVADVPASDAPADSSTGDMDTPDDNVVITVSPDISSDSSADVEPVSIDVSAAATGAEETAVIAAATPDSSKTDIASVIAVSALPLVDSTFVESDSVEEPDEPVATPEVVPLAAAIDDMQESDTETTTLVGRSLTLPSGQSVPVIGPWVDPRWLTAVDSFFERHRDQGPVILQIFWISEVEDVLGAVAMGRWQEHGRWSTPARRFAIIELPDVTDQDLMIA